MQHSRPSMRDLMQMSFRDMQSYSHSQQQQQQQSVRVLPLSSLHYAPMIAPQASRVRPVQNTPDDALGSYEQLLLLDAQNVRVGVPSSVRERLPRYAASRTDAQNTCPVCLEHPTVGTRMCKLPCGHSFHDLCIGKWMESSKQCPVCRSEVCR
jgi:hypothetical protein